MKQLVLKSPDTSIVCNNSLNHESLSFVSMVQVYRNQAVTNLKAGATVAYPVHVLLLVSYLSFRRYIIGHGHNFVGFLLVSTST